MQLDLARVGKAGQVHATSEALQRVSDVEGGVFKLVDAETGTAVRCIRGDTDEVDLVGNQVAHGTTVDAWDGVAGGTLAGTEQETDQAGTLRWVGLCGVQGVEVQSDTNLHVCVLATDDALDGGNHGGPLRSVAHDGGRHLTCRVETT